MKKVFLYILVLVTLGTLMSLATAAQTDGIIINNGIVLTNGETVYRLNGNTYEAIGTYIANPDNFPLAGQVYEGYVGSDKVAAYNATWTSDGRLWQPDLPSRVNRVEHTIAIKLLAGWNYTFNGVESTLNVDLNCDGKPEWLAADTEDGKEFSISADAGVIENGLRVVWGLVWSDTPSGGTEIIAVGPISAK